MAECINFGIIGCGAISEKHGQAIAQVQGARLVAVADVVEERARAFADKYVSGDVRGSRGNKVHLDYRRMLEDPDVDAVIIATPSGLHAKMGLDVLDAGKHALIEKPLALTSVDARSLIDKAEEVRKCLGTVHPNRYYPTSQMIHKAIQDGRLGKISHGVATVRWNRRASYYDEAPWRKTREMDGGILFNQAWHAFDALLWYMGSPVAEVQGMTATRFHDVDTEDIALVQLRFENGALGLVEATTNIYPKNLEHIVAIFGETGTIVQGGSRVDALKVWRVAGDDEDDCLKRWSDTTSPSVERHRGHVLSIEQFLNEILEKRLVTPVVEDALRLTRLINALHALLDIPPESGGSQYILTGQKDGS